MKKEQHCLVLNARKLVIVDSDETHVMTLASALLRQSGGPDITKLKIGEILQLVYERESKKKAEVLHVD